MIGIITFHRTSNFGSALQAYGLYYAINKLGYEAEMIDYRSEAIENREELNRKVSLSPREILKNILYYPCITKKAKRIWDFLTANCTFSPELTRLNIGTISGRYSKIFVGSDLVWEREITDHDYIYFLDFPTEAEKYAFSSSVGNYDASYDDIKIGALLSDFKSIAVREQDAIGWVKKIAQKDAVWVADPTMLLEPEEWERMIPPKSYTSKYVLVYFGNDKILNDATSYAHEHDLEVWVVDYSVKCKKNYHKVKPASINRFVGLIKSAECVFTASYHGMLFALYFNREIYYYSRENHNSRMYSLASKIGIEDRCADNGMNNSPIDYCNVNKALQAFREDSLNVLRKMLE